MNKTLCMPRARRVQPLLKGALRLWLLALLSLAANLAAVTTARITGTITDLQGAQVSGARVTLSDAAGAVVCETASDAQGRFNCSSIQAGQYDLTAQAPQFAPVRLHVNAPAGQVTIVSVQFQKLLSERQTITVVASAASVLTPDPSEHVLVHNQVLDANPGRPGAPISIPGYPIETASGGVKAPQYFAPGVAGDHGEPIAQFFQVGDYLFPNNLPANAHGNGYADPNFMITPTIAAVKVDGGAFNVRQGNNAVDLAASYEPAPHLNSFFQMTGDDRDADVVAGLGSLNPASHGWVAIEASYGNGFLNRLEHRQQYKLNGYREFKIGRHDLTVYGGGYYGFSRIPGLIPIDVPVANDTIDDRQLDRTHTSLLIASDTWRLSDARQLLISGFFRTYNLTLRSNFGDGLIQQSEFRTVGGGEVAYLQKVRPGLSFLVGADLRRDAPRNLDLKRLDAQGNFQPVTSNDLTLGFVEPFVSADGGLGKYLHYDLGVRREEVNFDNLDRINPVNSFNRLSGLTLPKGTLTVLAPDGTLLPSVAFSFGEAFHTNDPRIGAGSAQGSDLIPSRAYQMALSKEISGAQFKLTLARVANSQELAKIDPDTGLQEDVGPSLIRSVTVSVQRYFRYGSLYASFARANAKDRLTGADVPEAPRLIWDVLGTTDHLPLRLQARAEFEGVGSKPLGDGFTARPVRQFRGAVLRPFSEGRMEIGVNFLVASGFTGQTLETLALPDDSAPFERAVGVPLRSYISLTWKYNFGRKLPLAKR